jgi:quinol monooxygenase YgiN
MIHVVATITARPGTRPALLDAFRWLTPLVRAEVGCAEYQATVDVPTANPAQDPPRPDVVTVIEKWDGVAALAAHGAAPHMVEYREKMKDVVVSVKLQVTEPV